MNKQIAWIAALALAAFGSAAEAQTITAVYTTYSDTGVPTKLDITGTAFCTATPCGTKAPVVRLGGNVVGISGSSPTGIGVPLTGLFADGDYLLSVTPSGKTAITYAFTLKSKTGGGATGPQGPVGPQGPAGSPGSQGPMGFTGPQGVKGDTGATGSTGAAGAAGSVGAAGAKGDKGDTGDGFTFKGVWSTGASYVARDVVTEGGSSYIAVLPSIGVSPATSVQYGGGNWALLAVRGADGAVGPAGTAGAQGPQGLQGAKGDKGDAGTQGLQGLPGLQGVQGDVGPTGATGATGTAGPKGDKGDKGDIGLTGDSFAFKGAWSVTTSYASRDVVTAGGSTYLAITAHTGLDPLVDVANGGGNWTLLASRGADGAAGSLGPMGLQGLKGDKGDKGDTGAEGPAGPGGPSGAEGPQGLQGPPGVAGAVGAQGLIGPQGPMGLQGLTGDKGDTGPTGPKGDKGESGILTDNASNLFAGENAFSSNQNGVYNTAIGFNTLNAQKNGFGNTALGMSAGAHIEGVYNTAIGYGAIFLGSSGNGNTALGSSALGGFLEADGNTAIGREALGSTRTGHHNTALGMWASAANSEGSFNTALGMQALWGNSAGSMNIGIGYFAGFYLENGSNNIFIGNTGKADDSSTIRIGSAIPNTWLTATQSRTFIAGIYGANPKSDFRPVVIDSDGQLGTAEITTISGPAGIPGADGAQGPIGPQGPMGLQGLKGDKGDTGLTGQQGAQGAVGADGPQGAIGPKGDAGPPGAPGNGISIHDGSGTKLFSSILWRQITQGGVWVGIYKDSVGSVTTAAFSSYDFGTYGPDDTERSFQSPVGDVYFLTNNCTGTLYANWYPPGGSTSQGDDTRNLGKGWKTDGKYLVRIKTGSWAVVKAKTSVARAPHATTSRFNPYNGSCNGFGAQQGYELEIVESLGSTWVEPFHFESP